MKKNIFSVIITALTVINVVLTAVMFFVMLPTFQKTNTLISQVASVLNLELDADSEADPDSDYTISDLDPITVDFGEKDQTYNLKTGKDGKAHYAMMSGYVLNLNKKSDDYSEDLKETITTNQAKVSSIIASVIQKHTKEEATQDLIQKEALEEIRKMLDNKVAVDLVFDGYVTQ